MLSAGDLEACRATVVASMPDTAQVLRATTTPDGEGGQTTTWTVIATVPCRVAPADITPAERELAVQVLPRTLWRITVPVQTDVVGRDRIIVGSRTFEVLGVLDLRSLGLSTRVVAVRT